jgi:hypothetical protein
VLVDPLSPLEVLAELALLLPVAALHVRFGRSPLAAAGWALVLGGLAVLDGPTRPLALGGLVLGALLLERLPARWWMAALAGPLAVVGRVAESLWYEGVGHDLSTLDALLTPWWAVAALPLLLGRVRYGALCALLAPLLGLQASPGTMERGVLLITVDTLRKDEGEAMQSYKQLAARGTVWTDCLATSGWTVPSLASLHTGLAPWDHGAIRTGAAWQVGDVAAGTPLASSLPGPSVAVVTNPFVAYGLSDGFDSWTNLSLLPPAPSFAWGLVAERGHEDGQTVVDAALRELPNEGFVWVHLLDPHLPYTGLDTNLDRLRKGEVRPERYDEVRDAYRRDVLAADLAILRLLEHVEDEVVVVLTSDHGEEFWEHGGVEHGHSLYNELVEVPFVITGPVGLDATPRSVMDLAFALGVGPRRTGPRPLANTLYGPDLVGVDDGEFKLVQQTLEGTWMLLDTQDRPVQGDAPEHLREALPEEMTAGPPRPLSDALRALGYL